MGNLPARPRTKPSALPPVEQLDKRLCLGGMATATVADFAAPETELSQTSHTLLLVDREIIASPRQEESAPRHELPSIVAPSAAIQVGAELEPRAHADHSSLLSPALSSIFDVSPLFAVNSSNRPESRPTESSSNELENAAELSSNTGVQTGDSASRQGGATTGESQALTATQSFTASYPSLAEAHSSNDASANTGIPTLTPLALTTAQAQLNFSDPDEVANLLKRASLATASNDAIIAIVDRNGRILGVRVEADVLTNIPDSETLVFAIDGAVAKARTAALFSNGELGDSLAPLTSRTVRFISQSTNTQREVESNPNVDGDSLADANASTNRGPGFVAPIGVGGHFPPEVFFTPPVDLFAIEHTNRDSNLHPGADGIKGTADDIALRTSGVDADGETLGRFNIDPTYVTAGQELYAPESYGHVENSGLLPDAQSRGVATLPGGIPLFRDSDFDGLGDTLIGGIGVFFPGADGYATHEQGFVAGIGQTEAERTNAPKVLEAEFIALAAAGGSLGAVPWIHDAKVGDLGGVAAIDGLDLPFGRLDLVGITLEVIGPGSSKTGIRAVLDRGAEVGPGTDSGVDQPLANADGGLYREGKVVAENWLVEAHDSAVDLDLKKEDVEKIIHQAIAAADETRAVVRLPLSSRTRMVFAVTDTAGEVLGLYRMENATTFSIDVAVAKARNVAYYADAGDLEAVDQVVEAGTAFTNRTFRFLAEPRFPSGIDRTAPPVFSILNDDSLDPLTAENLGAPATVSEFDSVKGHDAFFPMTNFRDPGDAGDVVAAGGPNQELANQNGIIFFPGSTPLYKEGQLIGGFGVSGDGVDQDDVVTFLGAKDFLPDSSITRADQVFVNGVRLPFQKFLRNPFG